MNNRIWLKVLSILLGIFAWIYVNLVIPPQIRRTIVSEVEYRNLPEQVKILPQKATVKIQLEGTRRDFILSSKKKVQVTVDLYSIRLGQAQLPVKVTTSTGLSVVSISPPQVQVDVIPLIRKDFNIMVVSSGQPAEGYLADTPRMSVDRVTIEASQNILDKITGCSIEINLDSIKNSISETRKIRVNTKEAINLDEISFTPEKIGIDVMVRRGYPTKTVPLMKTTTANKPPIGKKLVSLTTSPESVTLLGPSRLLANIDKLEFKPVDLGQISTNSVVLLHPELPKQVKIMGSITPRLSIKVIDIKIAKLFDGLQFELNKGSSQHASVSVSSYSIEVYGYFSDIEQIRKANLKMVLDIENMGHGNYVVNLSAPTGLPDNVSVKRIIPDKLDIQILELPTVPDLEITNSITIKKISSESKSLNELNSVPGN